MLWLIQDNLFKEAKFAELISVIDRLGLPRTMVRPVPFTDRLIPSETDTSRAIDLDSIPDIPSPEGPAIVMGSYTLAKIASRRGWSPGAFLDGLEYDVWSRHWGHRILNPGAEICKFGETNLSSTKFVRPREDSKSFAGKVFDPDEWVKWKDTVLANTSDADPLNSNTEVVIAEPVEIWTENRLWVVGGQTVTHSQYKRGNKVIYSPNVDQEVFDFARECIDIWIPNPAVVMDVAQTPLGCKIVEVNCLNAAGFYAADMGKLVYALESRFDPKQ
jgi:hypothetical protein